MASGYWVLTVRAGGEREVSNSLKSSRDLVDRLVDCLLGLEFSVCQLRFATIYNL